MTTSRILAVLGQTRCRNAPGKTCFTPRGLWADLLFTPRLITISLSYTTLVKSLPNHIILFHPVSNSDANQLLKIKGQDSPISKMDSAPSQKLCVNNAPTHSQHLPLWPFSFKSIVQVRT